MGLLLNVDLETSLGPTQEAYMTIENIRANRAMGKIMFTTTCWLNEEAAKKFYKKSVEDSGNNAIGLMSSKVLYFENEESDGKEITLENTFEIPMGQEKEVEIPIYGEKEVSKEVPYISFDEDGNEITLYRTVTKKEKVQTGVEKVVKTVIDKSMMNNLAELCYSHLVEQVGKYIPKDKIQIV